ncbi:hypothetical protein [Phenylobacterium sp. J367]|uniref:hypothetical protein n=1 Tax=Phenylobacterium sp. J367 TaxID=2898435 RepID=UPI002150CFEA|nr:hypothetical protein [Phenylobacterium sp. J367]MCR5878731.1 hypothetical protein [Phenylobacterium sp. J367]
MRVLLASAVLTLTLAASEAVAQGSSGYDCRGFGSCGQPAAKDAKAQARPAKRERPAPPRTVRPLSQQGAGDPAAPDWRRRLGDAILEGRCEDARRIALEFGSVDMAVKSVRLCRPGPWLPLS